MLPSRASAVMRSTASLISNAVGAFGSAPCTAPAHPLIRSMNPAVTVRSEAFIFHGSSLHVASPTVLPLPHARSLGSSLGPPWSATGTGRRPSKSSRGKLSRPTRCGAFDNTAAEVKESDGCGAEPGDPAVRAANIAAIADRRPGIPSPRYRPPAVKKGQGRRPWPLPPCTANCHAPL